MDTQLTLDEVYQILGEKEIRIYKLQKHIQVLQQQLQEHTGTPVRGSGNGEADPRDNVPQRAALAGLDTPS